MGGQLCSSLVGAMGGEAEGALWLFKVSQWDLLVNKHFLPDVEDKQA